VHGVVARLRWESDDRSAQIAVLRTAEGDVVVKARSQTLDVGEPVEVTGVARRWRDEVQLVADIVRRELPVTRAGVVAWLGSGVIRGVGPAMAERIVAAFGERTLEVLETSPERLQDIEGIGPARARAIATTWREKAADRETQLYLQSHDIAPNLAGRIIRHYGARTVGVLRNDPYQLARDIRGVGFRTADRIAQALGLARSDPKRVRAGVEHTLLVALDDGHLFLPRRGLVEHAAAVLEIDEAPVAARVDELVAAGVLVREAAADDDRIWSRRAHSTECLLAEHLRRLGHASTRVPPLRDAALRAVEHELGLTLADGQRDALERLAGPGVCVLTGGPGTGKTTIVRALVRHLESARLRVELAAPTGRAAQRLSASTGREARTLHRALEYEPRGGEFARNALNPLECDVLVVDEASMLDADLALAVVDALRTGATLVLVGDVEQLPPVGPGDVLRDVIASDAVPVARLRRVFRQAAGSRITACAHAILAAELLEGDRDAGGEYFLVRAESPDAALETVERAVCERLPAAFGLDPVRDVQVLVPTHGGPIGTQALNRRLQARLFGERDEGSVVRRADVCFGLGDKVMQRRNNYDHDVYNGDIGHVCAVDVAARRVTVRYDGREVPYVEDEIEQIELAYAITVHKSQGSEFRAVVVVLTTHHFKLLQRNLLYTAVTRARERLLLVGMTRAFRMAIDDVAGTRRNTALAARIAGTMPTLATEPT
jgi:exodeoxyribonuclease V alpha subunit